MEISDIIRLRRSIKPEKFTPGNAIPHEHFKQILSAANWAPTHGNTEPWRFIIFSEEGRQKLSDFETQYYLQKTPEEKQVANKQEKARKRPLYCSHIAAVVFCRNLQGKVFPEWEEIASLGIAVQNMLLQATALNYASYWGSGGSTGSNELHQWLKLAENERNMGFLYFGTADNIHFEGKRKYTIEEKTTWIKT